MADAAEHGVDAGDAEVAAGLADRGQRRGEERRKSRVIESGKPQVARHLASKPGGCLHKPGGILVVRPNACIVAGFTLDQRTDKCRVR